MAKNQGRISVHYIPKNFSNGINILGFNLKVRNLLEGIFIGLIGGGAMYLFLGIIPNFDIGSRIGTAIAVLLAGVVGGIIGLNDEPLSEFFLNYMHYKNNKRTAFRNPRAHINEKSSAERIKEKNKNKLVNKIKAWFKNKLKANDIKEQKLIQEEQLNNYFDAERMFFKDDEDILKKPKEYMTDKELKEEERKQEEREKNIIKLAKKIERDKRYNEEK